HRWTLQPEPNYPVSTMASLVAQRSAVTQGASVRTFRKASISQRSVVVRAEESAVAKVDRSKDFLYIGSDANALKYLDGTLPADYGFDPLGLLDPVNSGGLVNPRWLQYSEVIHARWAMLGAAGCIAPEILAAAGVAPPETGVAWFRSGVILPAGQYDKYWTDPFTLFFIEVVLMQFAELKRLQDYRSPGSQGRQYFLGLEKVLGGSGDPAYPGGPFFNLFNLGKTEAAMKELKTKELKNGRLPCVRDIAPQQLAFRTSHVSDHSSAESVVLQAKRCPAPLSCQRMAKVTQPLTPLGPHPCCNSCTTLAASPPADAPHAVTSTSQGSIRDRWHTYVSVANPSTQQDVTETVDGIDGVILDALALKHVGQMGGSASSRPIWDIPPLEAPRDVQLAWWQTYVEQPWRSTRTIDLDRRGGLLRRPVARGSSFDASLNLLGDAVHDQAQLWEDRLQKRVHTDGTTYNTDGTLLRKPSAETDISSPSTPQPQPQPPSCGPPSRPITPASSALLQGSRRGMGGRVLRPGTPGGLGREVSPASEQGPVVAPWRLAVHMARRRAMLTVRAMLRLGGGLKQPTRLHRIDSFGLFIPQVLGPVMPKVCEEQRAYLEAKEGVDLAAVLGASLTCTPLLPSHGESSTAPDPPRTPSLLQQLHDIVGLPSPPADAPHGPLPPASIDSAPAAPSPIPTAPMPDPGSGAESIPISQSPPALLPSPPPDLATTAPSRLSHSSTRFTSHQAPEQASDPSSSKSPGLSSLGQKQRASWAPAATPRPRPPPISLTADLPAADTHSGHIAGSAAGVEGRPGAGGSAPLAVPDPDPAASHSREPGQQVQLPCRPPGSGPLDSSLPPLTPCLSPRLGLLPTATTAAPTTLDPGIDPAADLPRPASLPCPPPTAASAAGVVGAWVTVAARVDTAADALGGGQAASCDGAGSGGTEDGERVREGQGEAGEGSGDMPGNSRLVADPSSTSLNIMLRNPGLRSSTPASPISHSVLDLARAAAMEAEVAAVLGGTGAVDQPLSRALERPRAPTTGIHATGDDAAMELLGQCDVLSSTGAVTQALQSAGRPLVPTRAIRSSLPGSVALSARRIAGDRPSTSLSPSMRLADATHRLNMSPGRSLASTLAVHRASGLRSPPGYGTGNGERRHTGTGDDSDPDMTYNRFNRRSKSRPSYGHPRASLTGECELIQLGLSASAQSAKFSADRGHAMNAASALASVALEREQMTNGPASVSPVVAAKAASSLSQYLKDSNDTHDKRLELPPAQLPDPPGGLRRAVTPSQSSNGRRLNRPQTREAPCDPPLWSNSYNSRQGISHPVSIFGPSLTSGTTQSQLSPSSPLRLATPALGRSPRGSTSGGPQAAIRPATAAVLERPTTPTSPLLPPGKPRRLHHALSGGWAAEGRGEGEGQAQQPWPSAPGSPLAPHPPAGALPGGVPQGEAAEKGRGGQGAKEGAKAGNGTAAEAVDPAAVAQKLAQHMARLQRAVMLLSMYINRCNSQWAEAQQWAAPWVWELPEQHKWAGKSRPRSWPPSSVGFCGLSTLALNLERSLQWNTECGPLQNGVFVCVEFPCTWHTHGIHIMAEGSGPGVLRHSVSNSAAPGEGHAGSRGQKMTRRLQGGLKPYHEAAAAIVREGQLAVQIVVSEDALLPASTAPNPQLPPGATPAAVQGLLLGSSCDGKQAEAEGEGKDLDLWSSDPYDLIAQARPGMLHHQAVVKGWSLQGRALASLALAAQELGGSQAAAKLLVVLAVNEDQLEGCVRDLSEHSFYGLQRSNVLLTTQTKKSAYKWDPGSLQWKQDTSLPGQTAGTGLAALQLSWAPCAVTISADGVPTPLVGTALDLMAARGVSWLLSWRARDLALLGPRDALLSGGPSSASGLLLHALVMRDMHGADMVTQAMMTDTLTTARVADSVLLCNQSAQPRLPTDHAPGRLLMRSQTSSSITISSSVRSHATKSPPPAPPPGTVSGAPKQSLSGMVDRLVQQVDSEAGGSWACTEMRLVSQGWRRDGLGWLVGYRAELCTPQLGDVLVRCRSGLRSRYAVGLGRYAYHLPSLRKVLSGHNARLRPKLRVKEDALQATAAPVSSLASSCCCCCWRLQVCLDACDLTSIFGRTCVAVEVPPRPPQGMAAASSRAALSLEPPLPHRLLSPLHGPSQAALSGHLLVGLHACPLAYMPMHTCSPAVAPPHSPGTGAKLPLLLCTADLDTLMICSQAMVRLLSSSPLLPMLVFIEEGNSGLLATKMALALARPQLDTVVMTMFVSRCIDVEAGKACLEGHLKRLHDRPHVDVRTNVLVKGEAGLLDSMRRHVLELGADLMVLASQRVTSNSMLSVIGSVTLAIIKRVEVPTVVLTPACAAAVESLYSAKRGMRALAVVEPGAMQGSLPYLINRLLYSRTPDKLFLGQVKHAAHLTQQQQAQYRLHMTAAVNLVQGQGVPAYPVQMEGPAEACLAEGVVDCSAHLLALQLPPEGRSIPRPIVALLGHCKAALLLYRSLPHRAKLGGAMSACAFFTALVLNLTSLVFEDSAAKRTLALLSCVVKAAACSSDLLIVYDATPVLYDSGGSLFIPQRYVQWIVTTPLMVFILSQISDFSWQRLTATAAADVLMVFLGAMSHLMPGMLAWGPFLLSSLLFVHVMTEMAAMVGSAIEADASQSPAVRRSLQFICAGTLLIWSLFPVAWLMARFMPQHLMYSEVGVIEGVRAV
ncbi:hypothetical protein QJQ45_024902, partial [Haematococcus lacustris]